MQFSIYVWSDLGDRKEQQDNYSYTTSSVAVFDGHGKLGASASFVASLKFTELADAAPNLDALFSHDLEAAVIEDTQFNGGTTAVAAFLRPPNLYVANLGDSRGVVVRNGAALLATDVHTVENAQERERMLAGGSKIKKKRAVFSMTQTEEVSTAMTRALGYGGFGGMSAHPTIYTVPNVALGDIVVLGSDGLWDDVRQSEVVKQAYGTNPSDISDRILEVLAQRRRKLAGSVKLDNTTILVAVVSKKTV